MTLLPGTRLGPYEITASTLHGTRIVVTVANGAKSRAAQTPLPHRSRRVGADGAWRVGDPFARRFDARVCGATAGPAPTSLRPETRSVAGERARRHGGAESPFFSPDGQWIAFFATGKLKKVSVTGGAAVNLCEAPSGRGGAWTDDDAIIFTPAGAPNIKLLRVPSSGGTPTDFGKLGEGATTQRWPQALPGGKHVLYTESAATSSWDGANWVYEWPATH